jgi:hypothetical protein
MRCDIDKRQSTPPLVYNIKPFKDINQLLLFFPFYLLLLFYY